MYAASAVAHSKSVRCERYGSPMARALILGGTTEASELARALDDRVGLDVTTSFAGRTPSPRASAGRSRVGGFGGADGLADYLRRNDVDVLLDATHPFAARMRWHAAEAAVSAEIPRIRVERPPWVATADDQWVAVGDLAEAARAVAGRGRVFLTVGRTALDEFAACDDVWFLVRSINPPEPPGLAGAHAILDRGPFTVEGERALMIEHGIDVVVTKNSGGTAAAAKLSAARELGITVVMVERPPNPIGRRVDTVAAALDWLTELGFGIDQSGDDRGV